MRKLSSVITVTITLLLWLAASLMVIASDITSAEYKTSVRVDNASTATTNVATPFELSTSNMIAGGMLDDTADDCAMLDATGNDVAFMPGIDSNPWLTFVPSIGASSSLNQYLYSKGVTGGKIRYFPDTAGMTTEDSSTLELSNYTFEIELRGFWDTGSGSNKNAVYKEGAFKIYISGDQEITADVLQLGDYYSTASDGYLFFTSVTSYNEAWSSATGTVVGTDTTAGVGQAFAGSEWTIQRAALYFDTSAIPDDAVIESATLKMYGQNDSSATDFDITVTNGQPTYPHDPLAANDYSKGLYSGNGGSVNTSGYSISSYNSIILNSIGQTWINKTGTTKLMLKSSRDIAGTAPSGDEKVTFYMSEQSGTDKDPILEITWSAAKKVTAVGVSSGEHGVKVTYDGTDLKIYVADPPNYTYIEKDSLTASLTVLPNDYDWNYLQNGVMLYMEFLKITISGTLQQYIVWQYDNVFNDLSEGNHDATPSFRSTSSDADVTASVLSQLPATEPAAPSYTPTTGGWTMVPDTPGAPTGLYTEGGYSFPGGQQIKDIADANRMPVEALLFPLAIGSAVILGMVAFAITHNTKMGVKGSLWVQTVVTLGVCVFWYRIGGGVIPGWILIPWGIEALMLLMWRNPYNPTQ